MTCPVKESQEEISKMSSWPNISTSTTKGVSEFTPSFTSNAVLEFDFVFKNIVTIYELKMLFSFRLESEVCRGCLNWKWDKGWQRKTHKAGVSHYESGLRLYRLQARREQFKRIYFDKAAGLEPNHQKCTSQDIDACRRVSTGGADDIHTNNVNQPNCLWINPKSLLIPFHAPTKIQLAKTALAH